MCLSRDKVVDFHWNSIDPWTVVSVSDDCSSSAGGGTLQVIAFILIGRKTLSAMAESPIWIPPSLTQDFHDSHWIFFYFFFWLAALPRLPGEVFRKCS